MTAMDGHSLSGSWTHSFEEDTGDELVFRPSASFTFPPSRRPRDTLDFSAGQATTATPGPDDRIQRNAASMTVMGVDRLRMGDGRLIEVIEARPDLVRVRSR